MQRHTQQNNREEKYSDVLAWLGITESNLNADIDLQNCFRKKIKTKRVTQNFCLKMLECIHYYQWMDKKNFAIDIFYFASVENFPKNNKPEEFLNDFNQSLSVYTLRALSVAVSPNFDFLKRVITFAFDCIIENKTLMGAAHYEAVMQQLKKIIQDHSDKKDGVISSYLFGTAMEALAKIAEESNTPPSEKAMADWIKEIGQGAQKNQNANLALYNYAMKAYVYTDSPTWSFASKLINFAKNAKGEKNNEKIFSQEIEYFFINAINLSAAADKLDEAMAFYKAAAEEKYLRGSNRYDYKKYLNNAMGHALYSNIESGRLKLNSLPETLLEIISLQEKHTKMDIRIYTKAFDVLIKLKYYDKDLSKKIIEHAAGTRKLNKIMLASHFFISLQCKAYHIDEHLELYNEMKKQNEGYQDTLVVPKLYQNLILLIAHSPACSVEKAKEIFSEAKCSLKITINIYDAMLSVYDHLLMNNPRLSASDRKKYLLEFSLLMEEAGEQGVNLSEKSETTSVGQEQSLGKLYFQLKAQLDWLRKNLSKNASENFISIVLKENQENKSVFLKACEFLSEDFQEIGLFLELSSGQMESGYFQLSVKKIVHQEQSAPSETKKTYASVISSATAAENVNKNQYNNEKANEKANEKGEEKESKNTGKKKRERKNKNKNQKKENEQKPLVSQSVDTHSENPKTIAEIEKKDELGKSSQLDEFEKEFNTQFGKAIITPEVIQSEDLVFKQIEELEKASEKIKTVVMPAVIHQAEKRLEVIENSMTEKPKEENSQSPIIENVEKQTFISKDELEKSFELNSELKSEIVNQSEEKLEANGKNIAEKSGKEKSSESEEDKSQRKSDTIDVLSFQCFKRSFEEAARLTSPHWWSDEEEDNNIEQAFSSAPTKSAPTKTSDAANLFNTTIAEDKGLRKELNLQTIETCIEEKEKITQLEKGNNSKKASEPEQKKSQKVDTIDAPSTKSPWNALPKTASFFQTENQQSFSQKKAQPKGTWGINGEENIAELKDDHKKLSKEIKYQNQASSDTPTKSAPTKTSDVVVLVNSKPLEKEIVNKDESKDGDIREVQKKEKKEKKKKKEKKNRKKLGVPKVEVSSDELKTILEEKEESRLEQKSETQAENVIDMASVKLPLNDLPKREAVLDEEILTQVIQNTKEELFLSENEAEGTGKITLNNESKSESILKKSDRSEKKVVGAELEESDEYIQEKKAEELSKTQNIFSQESKVFTSIEWVKKERVLPLAMEEKEIIAALHIFNSDHSQDEHPDDMMQYVQDLKSKADRHSGSDCNRQQLYFIEQSDLIKPFLMAYTRCAIARAKLGLMVIHPDQKDEKQSKDMASIISILNRVSGRFLDIGVDKGLLDQMSNSLNTICIFLMFGFLRRISHFSHLSKTFNIFLNHFKEEDFSMLLLKLSDLHQEQDDQAKKTIIDILDSQVELFSNFIAAAGNIVVFFLSGMAEKIGHSERMKYKQSSLYVKMEFLNNLLFIFKYFISGVCEILKNKESVKNKSLIFYKKYIPNYMPPDALNEVELGKIKSSFDFIFDSTLVSREEILSFFHLSSRILLIEYSKPMQKGVDRSLDNFYIMLSNQMKTIFFDRFQKNEKWSALELYLTNQFYFHSLFMGSIKDATYLKRLEQSLAQGFPAALEARIAHHLLKSADVIDNSDKQEAKTFFYRMMNFIKEAKRDIFKSVSLEYLTSYSLLVTFPVLDKIPKMFFKYLPEIDLFKPHNLDTLLSETRADHILKNIKTLDEYKERLDELMNFYESYYQITHCFLNQLSGFVFMDDKGSVGDIRKIVSDVLPKKIKALELERNSFYKKKEQLHQRILNDKDIIIKREKKDKLILDKLGAQIQKIQKQIPKLKPEEGLSLEIENLFYTKQESVKIKNMIDLAINKISNLDYSGAYLVYQKLFKEKAHETQGEEGMLFCHFKMLMGDFDKEQAKFEVYASTDGGLNEGRVKACRGFLLQFEKRVNTFLKVSESFALRLKKTEDGASTNLFSLFTTEESKLQINSVLDFITFYDAQLNKAMKEFKELNIRVEQAYAKLTPSVFDNAQDKTPMLNSKNKKNLNKLKTKKSNVKNSKNHSKTQEKEILKVKDSPILSEENKSPIGSNFFKGNFDQASALLRFMERAIEFFENMNWTTEQRDKEKQIIEEFVRNEITEQFADWNAHIYSRLHQFLIHFLFIDNQFEKRCCFLFEIGFIPLLVFKAEISVKEIHPEISLALRRIQAQLNEKQGKEKINEALILAQLLSVIVWHSIDQKIIKKYLSLSDGIGSPLYLIAQLAKVMPECELYFYLLLSTRVNQRQTDFKLDARLEMIRNKIISYNQKVVDEVNIFTMPHFLFSFGLDPLSRIFKVKSPSQIFIKTSLKPSEFNFKVQPSVFIDSGNNIKDLIYVSKSESQDQDLYFMIKDDGIFQDMAGIHFSLSHIYFDYLRMDLRYGTLESKRDSEEKKLTWLLGEEKAHKNYSGLLNYIFYMLRLSFPSDQTSFLSLKDSVARLISDNIKKKNLCVPAGLISKEDLNVFFNRFSIEEFKICLKYLADSGLLFIIFPIPISLYPLSELQVSEIVKTLDEMDIKSDTTFTGMPDLIATVLYNVLKFASSDQVLESIKSIRMQLKNYLSQDLSIEVEKSLDRIFGGFLISTSNSSISALRGNSLFIANESVVANNESQSTVLNLPNPNKLTLNKESS